MSTAEGGSGNPGGAAKAVEWGETGFKAYRREQGRISRHRLYPMTAFYGGYGFIILFLALRSGHPFWSLFFYFGGFIFWTFVEYLAHRYVLHGRFADGEGIIRKFLHQRIDPLHWEHHDRPFDGNHINGTIRDTIPLFLLGAPLSFLAPIHTIPVALAGYLQAYVLEEWIHHSTHFYDFNNRYFRYIKRHHWYHHGPRGMDLGYGLTSGFWDAVFHTRYPESVRRLLYKRLRRNPRAQTSS